MVTTHRKNYRKAQVINLWSTYVLCSTKETLWSKNAGGLFGCQYIFQCLRFVLLYLIYYSFCLSLSACDLQDTVLPEAVTYWSKALRVRKTENRIRLSRYAEPAGLFEKGILTPRSSKRLLLRSGC